MNSFNRDNFLEGTDNLDVENENNNLIIISSSSNSSSSRRCGSSRSTDMIILSKEIPNGSVLHHVLFTIYIFSYRGCYILYN